MKSKFLKTLSVISGIVVLSACSGPKDDKKNDVVPTVGPQGHVQATGANDSCEIANGRITCSYADQNTNQTCSTSPRVYDPQNLASFCEIVRSIYNESTQFNGCNVQAVARRMLSEHCANFGGAPQTPPNSNPNWPPNPGNPGNPGNPTFPPGNPSFPPGNGPFPPGGGNARLITCSVISNNSYPTYMYLRAGLGTVSTSVLSLTERRGGVAGFFGLSRNLGQVKVSYQPQTHAGLPETLTARVTYNDRETGRELTVKHSGFAGSSLSLAANLNGADVSVNCNQGATTNAPLNEAGNLVCQIDSQVVGGPAEAPSQFIKEIRSFQAGEEVAVSSAIRISLDKATSMLTVHTNIDPLLGPNMTSSSSLRSNTLTEAYDDKESKRVGRAKMTCTIR